VQCGIYSRHHIKTYSTETGDLEDSSLNGTRGEGAIRAQLVDSRLIFSCADDVVEVFGSTREWTGIRNRNENSRLARLELRCQSR
jgi:hypothetical protein